MAHSRFTHFTFTCSPPPRNTLRRLPDRTAAELAPTRRNAAFPIYVAIAALSAFLYGGVGKAGSDAIEWNAPEVVDTGVADVSSTTGRSVLFAFDAWHVVYEKSGDIFHRARASSGWGTIEQLTDDPADSRDPHIGLGGGFLHLVWQDDRSGHAEVWARRFDGTAWSDEECLTCDETVSAAPVVAGMEDLAQVVWQEGESPSSVRGRRFESGAWGSTEAISSAPADAVEPSIAFAEDGEFDSTIDVVWADARTGSYQIFHRAWNEELGWHGEIGITDLPGDCRNPSVHEEICCGDWINPDYFVTFECDASGVTEVYSVWPNQEPAPVLLSADDGVPSVRPNLHGFLFSQSECGFGGVAPSYFATWSDIIAAGQHVPRIARIVDGSPIHSEVLAPNALGQTAVGAIEGDPDAGVMASWVDVVLGQSTLLARLGGVTGCFRTGVEDLPSIFLIGPEGVPANHVRFVDECTGSPDPFVDVMVRFDQQAESDLTFDLAQDGPPFSQRSDQNGEATFSIRGGGCSTSGYVQLWCFYDGLWAWAGVKSPDITGDCRVTDMDLEIVTARLGTDDFCADLDGSGLVDQADLAIVEATLGDECASTPSSVEPPTQVDGFDLTVSPNPVRDHVDIRLRAPNDGIAQQVDVKILDASGRLVRTLAPIAVSSGDHRIVWDTKDDAGRSLPSGLYFASAQIGSEHLRRVFVVLR